MTVIPTTDDTFAADVLDAPMPVLVEFTADWCPPCRAIAPTLERISVDQAQRMQVVSLDIDAHPRTAADYQVLAAPTLVLFRGGEPVARFVGAKPRATIMTLLEPHLTAAV